MIERLAERALLAARARGIRPPRAYWAARYGPARLLARAGIGPVAQRARETEPGAPGEPRLPRRTDATVRPVVLFYAINGTGLGHLTRCLAIARHLGSVEPVIVTTSVRADVLDAYGIRYVAVPPWEVARATRPGLTLARWNEDVHRTLREAFADFRPAVVAFDGVAPDPGFTRAIREAPQIGRVGIRRAYRLDGREHLVIERDAEMDLLVVPHEPGSEQIPLPQGPDARWVGSVSLTSRRDAMSRDEARVALRLTGERQAVIVQLGSGALGRSEAVLDRLLSGLAALDVDVVATSYRGGETAAGRVRTVSRFPLAPLFPAFDLAIAAAGYNTFTELMQLGVPSVLVPNEHMRSDDQLARARRAEQIGAALIARDGDIDGMLVAARRLLADEDGRRAMSDAARALVPRNGATAAAELLQELCERILARR